MNVFPYKNVGVYSLLLHRTKWDVMWHVQISGLALWQTCSKMRQNWLSSITKGQWLRCEYGAICWPHTVTARGTRKPCQWQLITTLEIECKRAFIQRLLWPTSGYTADCSLQTSADGKAFKKSLSTHRAEQRRTEDRQTDCRARPCWTRPEELKLV